MPQYVFSIHCGGEYQEDAGSVALPHDLSAREFGKRVIQDTLDGVGANFDDWSLDIIEGERIVCSMPFSRMLAH